MRKPRYFLVASVCLTLCACQETTGPTPQRHNATDATLSPGQSTEAIPVSDTDPTARPDLEAFRNQITPILANSCVQCHGPDKQKGKLRLDTLDPDMIGGADTEPWLAVMDVLTHNEMPPPDADLELAQADRGKVVEWISSQVLAASNAQRGTSTHSSFRRMTRYEFSYALQDLLGLPHDFSKDLPPETVSEDGFRNSSEMLQMTALQFSTYQEMARQALEAATVRGPRPEPTFFAITMDKADTPFYLDWATGHRDQLIRAEEERPSFGDAVGRFRKAVSEAQEARLSERDAYFLNRETGEGWNRRIPYGYSLWEPTDDRPSDPDDLPFALVLPHGQSQELDLGDYLPDRGVARIRFRANRASDRSENYPSLRLYFGFKGNNNSTFDFEVSEQDIAITAPPGQPAYYEWHIALDAIERNPFRGNSVLGKRPNPSERITFANVHQGSVEEEHADVHIDYIEITAPIITQWPPASHRRVFPERAQRADGTVDARAVLADFMPRAWRRPVSAQELGRKLDLFKQVRPLCADDQEAMIEVLAAVLASPHFLYLAASDAAITDGELASRLSFFLWAGQPDQELLDLVASGAIREPGELAQQTRRMLNDPRADRFAQHFTHQWLGMELLDHFQANRGAYPDFSNELKRSMLREPIESFQYVLNDNRSVIEFLHADYALVNQRLAAHYGIDGVYGNHFRRVDLPAESARGGLLTQAGLLAMNSDGKDSNPLKRGVWLLERILHDPPPPPPPAVPQIDLADPEIVKMTLKERMEDHRNDPACASCHVKIDPWGIAFEHFDAVGAWRDQINGQPVDATSYLNNENELAGIDGLKRYLLDHRQDQFRRAMVHKLSSYALGRPLGLADHAEIERITAELRQNGDGLQTLLVLIVESDLFQTN